MGWFSGPTIKERNRGGRIEYYGKCDECKKEQTDTNKRDLERKLERCERDDKRAKEKAEEESRRKRKKREQERKRKKREQEEREERTAKLKKEKEERENKRKKELERQAEEVQEMLMKGRNHYRRQAKNKCPFCGKKPCAGTKPKCAKVKAAGFENIANTGAMDDPATFDAQLKFYRDNM